MILLVLLSQFCNRLHAERGYARLRITETAHEVRKESRLVIIAIGQVQRPVSNATDKLLPHARVVVDNQLGEEVDPCFSLVEG